MWESKFEPSYRRFGYYICWYLMNLMRQECVSEQMNLLTLFTLGSMVLIQISWIFWNNIVLKCTKKSMKVSTYFHKINYSLFLRFWSAPLFASIHWTVRTLDTTHLYCNKWTSPALAECGIRKSGIHCLDRASRTMAGRCLQSFSFKMNLSRVSVISHQDIYPDKSHLPTFSSPSIEESVSRSN